MPGDEGRAFAEAAVTHHGVVDRQAVFLADYEIVLAMRGRGMNRTGSRLERHMVTDDDGHVLGQERMRQLQMFEHGAFELHQHLTLAEAVTRETRIQQLIGEH